MYDIQHVLDKLKGVSEYSEEYSRILTECRRVYSKPILTIQHVVEVSLFRQLHHGKIYISLNIKCKNFLQNPLLIDLLILPKDNISTNCSRGVSLDFILQNASIPHINQQLIKIFARMRAIGLSPNDEAYFLAAKDDCFFNFEPQSKEPKHDFFENVSPREEQTISNLLKTFRSDKMKVWQMLQDGYDPNTRIWGQPLLSMFIAVMKPEYRNFSKISEVVMLLLMYGADLYEPDRHGYTAVDWTIRLFDTNCGCGIPALGSELIYLLTASKTTRPFTNPHKDDQSPAAILIRQGNEVILKRNTPLKRPLFTMKPKIKSGVLSIDIIDYKNEIEVEVVVRRRKAQNLGQRRLTQMYTLFRSFPGQDKPEVQKSADDFNKEFIATGNEPKVELLLVGDQLVGFTIIEQTNATINGKATRYHRVTLAQNSPVIAPYKRLMTLASSLTGFVSQRKYPDLQVVGLFEAASASSFMQIYMLDCFPFNTLDFISFIDHFYPKAKRNVNGIRMYLPDPLAYKATSTQSSPWLDRSGLAFRFFNTFLYSPNDCVLAAFKYSPDTLQRIQHSLGALDGTTYEQLIEDMVPLSEEDADIAHNSLPAANL